SDAPLAAATIRACVERALAGAVEVDARPVPACVEPGETPRVRVVVRRPFVRGGETVPAVAHAIVTAPDGGAVFRGDVALAGPPELRAGELAIDAAAARAPGLYRVEVRVDGEALRPASTTSGFWVRDAALLASARPLTVSRDWLRRDGAAFPIVGTT